MESALQTYSALNDGITHSGGHCSGSALGFTVMMTEQEFCIYPTLRVNAVFEAYTRQTAFS